MKKTKQNTLAAKLGLSVVGGGYVLSPRKKRRKADLKEISARINRESGEFVNVLLGRNDDEADTNTSRT